MPWCLQRTSIEVVQDAPTPETPPGEVVEGDASVSGVAVVASAEGGAAGAPAEGGAAIARDEGGSAGARDGGGSAGARGARATGDRLGRGGKAATASAKGSSSESDSSGDDRSIMVCEIRPCLHIEGEEMKECGNGCKFHMHQSCYASTKWVKEYSTESKKPMNSSKKPKPIPFLKDDAVYCEKCVVSTVRQYLNTDNGRSYATVNEDRLKKAKVWIKDTNH